MATTMLSPPPDTCGSSPTENFTSTNLANGGHRFRQVDEIDDCIITKPRRPLSAYNLFFQNERRILLETLPDSDNCLLASQESIAGDSKHSPNKSPTLISSHGSSRTTTSGGSLRHRHRSRHGKIGFALLARTVAAKWKAIDDETRAHYERLAHREKECYEERLDRYNEHRSALIQRKIGRRLSSLPQSSALSFSSGSMTLNNMIFQSGGGGGRHRHAATDAGMTESTTMDWSMRVSALFPEICTKPFIEHMNDLARQLDVESIDFILDLFKD